MLKNFFKTCFNLKGLSLLELVTTMVIVSVAASVVLPVGKIYVTQNIEEKLKTNLSSVREAINKYHTATGNYPRSIDILLQNRYLRRMELEPFGGRWQYRPSMGEYTWKDFVEKHSKDKPHLTFQKSFEAQGSDRIFDIRTTASNTGTNGILYTEW